MHHDGVVVAAAGAAHRALNAQRVQRALIIEAGVLATAITVVQQVFAGGAAGLDRVAQGLADEFRRQRMAHRPAHHLATEQIVHDGQVNPALCGRQVRDVGHPFAIGSRRREVLSQHVRSRLSVGSA